MAALGWVLYHAGEHAAAAEQCRQTLELNPDYAVAHLWGGWALQEMDSLRAAVRAHRRAVAEATCPDRLAPEQPVQVWLLPGRAGMKSRRRALTT